MSDLTVPFIFWSFLLLSFFHGLIAIALSRILRQPTSNLSNEAALPKVLVVLPLRDIELHGLESLRALLQLDYPHYHLQVVTPHLDNTSRRQITQLLNDYPAIPVHVKSPSAGHKFCSFTGSALIQTVSTLNKDIDVLAVLAPNMIPSRSWLKDLVIPLQDPAIGVTTGYRWYRLRSGHWRDICRYVWNGLIVCQMCLSHTPWEGSFALKIQSIAQHELLEIWQQSITTDVILSRLLRKQKLRVKAVPTLLMTRHIGDDFFSFIEWVKHRMLLLRLYHPLWPPVAIRSIIITYIFFRSGFAFLSSLLTGQWASVFLITSGLMIYLTIISLLLNVLEQKNQQSARLKGEPVECPSVLLRLKIFLVIPFVQVLHSLTTVSTLFVRSMQLQHLKFDIKEL